MTVVPLTRLEPAPGPSWTDLPLPEQMLVWAMRHMLVCWPTCGSVRAALLQAHGDAATGIEHLVRCWLAGLSLYSRRPLKVGDPTCAPLLPDEGAMLYALRAAAEQRDAEAAEALVELCDEPVAICLLPLARALAEAAEVRRRLI
jgi:hypothetical protein